MIATLENLKLAAAGLSMKDRGTLASFLLESLEENIDESEAADIRREWLAVAKSRMDEVRAGKAVGIPVDEFLQTLREQRS